MGKARIKISYYYIIIQQFKPIGTNDKLTCRNTGLSFYCHKTFICCHLQVKRVLFDSLLIPLSFDIKYNRGIIENLSVNCCRVTSDRQTHRTHCVSLWRKVCVTGLPFRVRLGLKYLLSYDYQRILFLYRVFYFGVSEEMYVLIEKNPYTVHAAWQKQAVLAVSVWSK